MSCSILNVNCGIVSPTLNANATLFIIPCIFLGVRRIIDVQCCNYCHLPSHFSSKFQSSLMTFSSQVTDKRRSGFGPWMKSFIIRDKTCSLIHKKRHPRSCHSDIKYHMALNIIFSIPPYNALRCSKNEPRGPLTPMAHHDWIDLIINAHHVSLSLTYIYLLHQSKVGGSCYSAHQFHWILLIQSILLPTRCHTLIVRINACATCGSKRPFKGRVQGMTMQSTPTTNMEGC